MRVISLAGGCLIIGLAVFGASDNAVSARPAEHCGQGDVTSLAQAGGQGFVQLERGKGPTGLADAVLNCQARLYDDNGPDVPHVWCEHDLFLLGIGIFDNYKLSGLPRSTVAGFLEQLVNEVSFHGSLGNMPLIVERSATKDLVSPSFGHLVTFGDSVILGDPVLLPGNYTWEWIQKHPIAVAPDNPQGVLFVGGGEVEIVSHEDHLTRIAAGTW